MNPKGLAPSRRMKKSGRAAVIPLGEINNLKKSTKHKKKNEEEKGRTRFVSEAHGHIFTFY